MGGQVVVSAETLALLEPGRFELRHLGQHRLKDLSSPIPLHQLVVEQLPQGFPRLKTLYHSTLPVPATPFLGREQELAEVTQRLLDPDTRLLTLTGPGGTGKTRLGLQAAAEVSDEFPDGVWWVPLAPLRDPALVMPSLARVLELPEQPGVTPLDLVAKALIGKRTLVVLDNAEHLLPDLADELAALTAACPTLRVLLTSRERLQIGVERSWPVPALTAVDAVALFVQRATAAGVLVEPGASVAEVCARLDFLPLAIELAAARVRSLSVAAILGRLDERLELLASRDRDVDERHRTLRATIEWSYDLLDPLEQRALRALSVFAGGCALEAAHQVAGADLGLIESLLDKSLVRHRLDDVGTDRYWMLETIREFAAERLAAVGDEDRTRAAHADWYAAFAAPPDGVVWSAPVERADGLEAELANLRLAYDWFVARGDAERAQRLAIEMWVVWEMRDRLAEGRTWLDRALALPGAEQSVARASCLQGRAVIAYFLGETEESMELAEAGVAIMREVGSDEQIVTALLALTWTLRFRDEARARLLLEEALVLARRVGTPLILRTTLHNVGEMERNAGNYDVGAAHLEEALAVARELGDPAWIGAIGHSLGDLELLRGHAETASTRYLEAADACVEGRFPAQTVLCVGGLAAVAAQRGDDELARRLWHAVEHWEDERGITLPPTERAPYELAVADLVTDDDPPLSLEDAIELARATAPRQ